eukprot:sb/3472898/
MVKAGKVCVSPSFKVLRHKPPVFTPLSAQSISSSALVWGQIPRENLPNQGSVLSWTSEPCSFLDCICGGDILDNSVHISPDYKLLPLPSSPTDAGTLAIYHKAVLFKPGLFYKRGPIKAIMRYTNLSPLSLEKYIHYIIVRLRDPVFKKRRLAERGLRK